MEYFKFLIGVGGGLGFGTLMAAIINFYGLRYVEKKRLDFNEKLTAYKGLLLAMSRIASKEKLSGEDSFEYWLFRCSLVCNDEVFETIK